jgi:site-specific DNA recombinase
MGYKTKFGNAFGNNSLHTILSNVKYAGIMVYNLRLEKGLDGKRRPTLKPEEEVIRVEGVIPQIIPTDMFDKAQVMLERNAINGGRFKAKIPYLLSGL